MQVALSLHPVWLRTRFSRVRFRLLGKAKLVAVPELNFVNSEIITSYSRGKNQDVTQPDKVLTSPNTVSSPTITAVESDVTNRFDIFRTRTANFLTATIVAVALVVAGVVFAPDIYYLFAPVSSVAVSAQEAGSVAGGDFEAGTSSTRDEAAQQTANAAAKQYLPPQDENLPQGEWLSIPRIGVKTEFLRTVNDEDPETALRVGVWFVPGYGEPGDLTQPMIMAAHRFGYEVWWQSDYWKYNSFYFLPDTQPGDKVEIIKEQRRYVYEIYAGEESDQITDYDADLILYTCKFLNSPVRHVRYARLLVE